MVWTNPTPLVVNFRDALIATTTIGTTIGIANAAVHYPNATPATDPLPLIVIDPPAEIEGERDDVGGSVLSGKFEATILFADSVDVGTIETYREQMARDLVEWMSESLAIYRTRVSRAQLPSAGQRAGGDAGQPDTGCAYKGLIVEAWFRG